MNNEVFVRLYKTEGPACESVLNNLKRYLQASLKVKVEENEKNLVVKHNFRIRIVKELLRLNSIAHQNYQEDMIPYFVNQFDISACDQLIRELSESLTALI